MTTATKQKKPKVEKLVQKIGDHEQPVPFEESFKFPGAGKLITFTGDSYDDWVRQMLPGVDQVPSVETLSSAEVRSVGIAVGSEYLFYRRPLDLMRMVSPWGGFGFLMPIGTPRPARCLLEIYQRTTEAYVGFDRRIYIPVLCDQDLKPWMSLTPNEILTLRGQIRRASGHTVVAGLGLGWSARKMLQRKQVTKLTVVERDQAVIDYFGGPLEEEFGDRVEFVGASAYDFDWLAEDIDVGLWDIWDQYGYADSDSTFRRIRDSMRKAGKVCMGWGDNIYKD